MSTTDDINNFFDDENNSPLLTEKESGQIPGYLGKQIYSDFDKKKTSLIKENQPIQKKTILDMPLKDIMKNTSNFIDNFNKDLAYNIRKVELENNLKENDFFSTIKKYILGFSMLATDKDNMIHLGIILIVMSIIIYFFNISRND
tara:strand:- start:63 stop:497 length:435 start_codon:yes stop_codon:yes gene_type:complete